MEYEDFEWYRGSVPWLKDRTIFLTKHGSHAYGTSLPSSDVDLKGICIPPKEYYLGNLNKFEQAENKGHLDAVIFGINKFIELASNCNPNIIEVLFTDSSDWILLDNRTAFRASPWKKLLDQRHLFVTQKAKHTFSGYAVSQLNRIETHRAWLLHPVEKQPQRQDFGLPQNDTTLGKENLGVINAAIRKVEDEMAGKGFTKDQVAAQEEHLVEIVADKHDIGKQMIQVIINERRYASAMRNWNAYSLWKQQRNPKRAELEAKFGYDAKHAMHLVRLLTMAEEILTTGKVIVKRPDAERLLEVRAGVWAYDALVEWARMTEKRLDTIQSPLPHGPDRVAIDRLLMEIVEEYNF